MSNERQSSSSNGEGINIEHLSKSILTALLPEINRHIDNKLLNLDQRLGETGEPESVLSAANVRNGQTQMIDNHAANIRTSRFVTGAVRTPTGIQANNVEDDQDSEGELIPGDGDGRNRDWKPSDKTEDVLLSLRSELTKSERGAIGAAYPLPDRDMCKAPKLDDAFEKMMKQRKINFRQIPGLSSVETLEKSLLQIAGPLTHLHSAAVEAAESNQPLDSNAVLAATTAAIDLVGNANGLAIYERRRMLLKAINPELSAYATHTGGVTHELFGQELRDNIKQAIDLNFEVDQFNKMTTGTLLNDKYQSYRCLRNFDNICLCF